MESKTNIEDIIQQIEVRGQLLTPEEKMGNFCLVGFKDGAKEWFPESWLTAVERTCS